MRGCLPVGQCMHDWLLCLLEGPLHVSDKINSDGMEHTIAKRPNCTAPCQWMCAVSKSDVEAI